MTSQSDLNKDFVALLSSVTDGIHQLQEAVKLIHTEINHLKSSQNILKVKYQRDVICIYDLVFFLL